MGVALQMLIRACALGLAALPALAAQVVDPAAARRAAADPHVAAAQTHLSALAADGRVSELALRVQRIAADRTLQPVAREWLLDRGLHELARLAPTPEARAVVQGLASRRPEVFTRVDPDHGDRVTPMYDTGATARFVLRAWERQEARRAAEADLAAGRTAVIDRYAATAGPGPVREGIVEAFLAAPAAQLAVQRNAAAAAMAAGRRADEVALALARRLADAELAALVIGHADSKIALDAVQATPTAFDAQTAVQLLALASRRADVASAALLQAGRFASQDAGARGLLLDSLADPALGPSAAAALAAAGDAAVTSEIGRRLNATSSDWLRGMYVLALKLDAGPAAREALRRFLATRRGPAKLRSEVRQWLAH